MSLLNFNLLRFLTVVIIGAAVLLTPSIGKIQYRSDIIDYFKSDDLRVQQFIQLQNSLGLQQSLLIMLSSESESFLSENALQTLFHTSQQIENVDGVTQVRSLLSNAVSDSSGDTHSLYRHLKLGKPLDQSVIGQTADNITSNPLLLSQDQQVATVQVKFDSEEIASEAYPNITRILDSEYGKDYRLLGPVEIKHALHHALLHDGFYLMPAVVVLGLIVMWYFLRSVWLVTAGSASIVVALWLSAGIVGFFQFTVNQTSALAFCIAFIIALADIIHLQMSFTMKPNNKSAREAMLDSLRGNILPLFLTSLTTGIGFLSLNASSSPVFATFGNIAAIGVVCAFIAAVTITPVLAVLMPRTDSKNVPQLFQHLIKKTNTFRQSFGPMHYVAFYGLSILLSLAILLNQYNNDPIDYFESKSAIAQANQLSEQAFSVHHPVSIQLDSGEKEGVFTEKFLRTTRNFETWLAAHPSISTQSSFMTTLTALQRHVHQNNLKWANTPTDPQQIADLWNLYEMASPHNNSASLGIDPQFQSITITVGIPRLNSNELMYLESEIQQWFRQENTPIKVSVTGHAMLFASVGRELIVNMFVGGIVSALVISVLIGLFLGNIRVGMLSLIPNLFPAGFVYGVWGCTVGVIDLAAAGTLCISLGIVVDDSIHILKRYIILREAGTDPATAIDRVFEEVGPALILTTLVLSIGLAVLTLSIFGPNQTTAIIMTSIIVVALAYDLLMLPQLLIWLDRFLFPASPLPHTNVSETESPSSA